VSQAILGTPVMILKYGNYWSLIQTPDRYIAWTETSAVKSLTVQEFNEWKGASKVIFLENCSWIYDAPDAKHSIGDLVLGSVLVKIKESGAYTNVKYPDGREGFISSKTLADFESWKNKAVCTEESICRVAETFLGLPYLWGGSSSKAVDCSGFIQSVFFRNGMIMSRDASLQAEHGISIDPSGDYANYRRGDLLFFGTRTDSGLRITHVAIYKGDSEYIHSAGRVKINSLDSARVNYSDFRRSSLLAVRRIAGFDGDDGAVPVAEHSWY
jgi:cell wall-associated NlpC family hydrolase